MSFIDNRGLPVTRAEAVAAFRYCRPERPAARTRRKPGRGFWVGTAVYVGLTSALVVWATGARAHEAISGWSYDGICCSQANPETGTGDCAPIPASSVQPIPGGFIVTLNPGDHPDVTRPHRFEVRFEDLMYRGSDKTKIQYSGDGDWHACLYPNEDTLRCLYIIPGGV